MLTQLRLYAVLGAVVAFMALGLVAYHFKVAAHDARAERDKAQAALATAVEANKQAAATIDAMQEQSRLDGRLAADLAAKNRQLSDDLSDKDAELNEEKKQNADLRAFLDQHVPADLGRLYNH